MDCTAAVFVAAVVLDVVFVAGTKVGVVYDERVVAMVDDFVPAVVTVVVATEVNVEVGENAAAVVIVDLAIAAVEVVGVSVVAFADKQTGFVENCQFHCYPMLHPAETKIDFKFNIIITIPFVI